MELKDKVKNMTLEEATALLATMVCLLKDHFLLQMML